ncbi:MAG: WD40/YVTN/BNR-like repeat-containing protein, partial [Longimicrobiales bacterium]
MPLQILKGLAVLTLLVLAAPAVSHAQELRRPRDVSVDEIFQGMTARSIGPAGTSGRVASIAVSPIDDRVIYVGAATGGLWRSKDGGYVWDPIMDDVAVNSIGAIAVSPAAPHIVWVGTGEANAR